MEYLDKVLGVKVTYDDVEFKHLPNFIATRYRLQMVSMNEQKMIFLYPKTELEQIEVLKKHIARIQKNENLPVVLVLKELSFRQKEYLIREKIPFIVDGKQIYLPFMAVYLQERCSAEKKTREEILPSEKAFTYKSMLEAKRRQAGRPRLKNASPVATNFPKGRADEELAEEVGEGKDTIRRYIRLTYLIPELLDLVDQGKMSIRPAVEVSYIDSEGQKSIYEYYQDTIDIDENGKEISPGVLPSLAQAKEMRGLASNVALDEVQISRILGKLKPNQKPKITLKDEKILRYGRNLTPKEFEEKIIKALDYYEKHMAKEQAKDIRMI